MTKTITICLAERCVWRTQVDEKRAYCPFGKCPYNVAKEYKKVVQNDYKNAF